MGVKSLLIKNKINYPLEEIIDFNSLNIENTIIDELPGNLNLQQSDFDVIIIQVDLSSDLEGDLFHKISRKTTPLILLTSIKNREMAGKLSEHCLFWEELTPLLLETSIKLVIQEKRNTRLNKTIEEYQDFLELSKNNFSKDMTQIIQKEREFFHEYNNTKSELKWLEILLNAVPCGIVIFDRRKSDELIMNRESLMILGITPPEAEDKNLIYTNDLNSFFFYSVNGKKIITEDLPFFKSVKGEDIKDLELIVKNQAKGEVAVLINSSPVYDKSGSVIASITAISDMSLLKKAERDLTNTINVQNIITEEFNNRILNILQTITSLLSVTEELNHHDLYTRFYQGSKVKFNLIRRIQEKLSSYDDDKYADFSTYAQKICSELLQFYNLQQQVNLEVEGSAVMTLDLILPCGLILDEIVNYRLKSFINCNQKFNLLVKLKAEKGKITLEIIDNGPSIGRMTTDEQLKLTSVLLEQLSGLLRVESGDNSSFLVEILYLDI
ncbi:MAG: histidine kinase dimerization/phosphoacceptor domain -containing protein [Methanobacterium formicicum]|uniref:histidine kinase dimerization/phosphoacceptor domain -containing protein n=1 Tax=Methanobacterium formicicum TaxID=2162 RepID=UPI0035312C1B